MGDDDDGGDLAATCHELHQPLGYLISSLETLRHALAGAPGDEAARARGWIDRASTSARRIDELVRDVEPLCRPAQARPLDLAAVVAATLDTIDDEIHRRAELTRVLAPGVFVWADAARLRQLVLHLVVHAWLALPDAAPPLHRIHVRVARAGDRALVEVESSDGGDGEFADGEVSRAAAPWFTTERDGRPLALGLAICKRIVHGCRGLLEIEPRPDGGQRVRALLPACEVT